MEKSKGVISNFLWRLAERSGAQGVSLLVSIILARLLSPEDYGVIALVMVFISVLNVFVDSGLGNSLIQKKDADDLDFSSVFYFNVVICCFLYFIMFVSAPLIGEFYHNKTLIPVVRVLSLNLIISGVKNIQQAYVSRTMQFKKFFFATLGGTIGAAIIGIMLAYLGFGVWALVIQQLFNIAVDTIILWITVKWRPKLMFSFQRLKSLFGYGWKLLASSLLETLYNNVRTLIIGRVYSATDLAYYNQGKKFPDLMVTNIITSINSVLFPTMSKEQDNTITIKNMTRRSIRMSSFIMSPLMIGMTVCASPMINLIFTSKWESSTFYLQVFCISYLLMPIHASNLNAIKALGRSDIFLKLEIIKKVLGIIAICISMCISVKAMAVSLLITSFISQLVNSVPNKKLMDYGYFEQLKDILPNITLSMLMAMVIFPVNLFKIGDLNKLIIMLPLGIMVYVAGAKIFHLEPFDYLVNILLDKRKN